MSLRVVLSIAAMWFGVEGVAQPERVGGDADAEAEQMLRHDDPEEQHEPSDVQPGDDEGQEPGLPPLGGRQGAPDLRMA